MWPPPNRLGGTKGRITKNAGSIPADTRADDFQIVAQTSLGTAAGDTQADLADAADRRIQQDAVEAPTGASPSSPTEPSTRAPGWLGRMANVRAPRHFTIWDFATGTVLAKRAFVHRGIVDGLAAHVGSDGRVTIATGGEDGFLRKWTTELELVAEIDLGEAISALTWTSERAIAVGTDRGLLVVQFG